MKTVVTQKFVTEFDKYGQMSPIPDFHFCVQDEGHLRLTELHAWQAVLISTTIYDSVMECIPLQMLLMK